MWNFVARANAIEANLDQHPWLAKMVYPISKYNMSVNESYRFYESYLPLYEVSEAEFAKTYQNFQKYEVSISHRNVLGALHEEMALPRFLNMASEVHDVNLKLQLLGLTLSYPNLEDLLSENSPITERAEFRSPFSNELAFIEASTVCFHSSRGTERNQCISFNSEKN